MSHEPDLNYNKTKVNEDGSDGTSVVSRIFGQWKNAREKSAKKKAEDEERSKTEAEHLERLKLKCKNLSELGNDLFKITQCSSSKAITSLSLLAEGNKKLKHALAKNDRNELLVAHEIFKNAEGLTKEVADLS